jgi:hypothetical protein
MKPKLRKVFVKNSIYYNSFIYYILGEIYELKAELNSDKRDRKKEAVKKVINRCEQKRKIFFII